MMSRRDAIAVLASTVALPFSGCSREGSSAPAAAAEADALALLDQFAENLLRLVPEGATSLGVDTGPRAALRSWLTDRSTQGQDGIANQVRADVARANAFDTSRLSYTTRTSVDVVRSAY